MSEDHPSRASDDRSEAEARTESSDPAADPPSSPAEATAPESGPALEAVLEPPPEAGALEAYHQRARLAEDRLQEVLGAYRRIKTENDGYRDRLTRNLERRFEQRRERLLLRFIDVLDNLDRALEAAQTAYTDASMLEGMILVRTQLLQTLQEEGLERIPVLGLPYDPHVSEAVGTTSVEDPEHHGLVTKEMLRGYRFGGRVVRASRVMLGEHAQRPPTEVQPGPTMAGPEVEEAAEASSFSAADEGPSLEEIIARAEAQDAPFKDAFPLPAADAEGPVVDPEQALEAEIDAALGAVAPAAEEEAVPDPEVAPADEKDPQSA